MRDVAVTGVHTCALPISQDGGVLLGKVPTAAVEVHQLFQRGHAAVVHVRPGEFYVPETGCLEGALRASRVSCREGQVERPDRGTDAQVVVDAANTRVEESGVATADETVGLDTGGRGRARLGASVALGALSLAGENAHATLLLGS